MIKDLFKGVKYSLSKYLIIPVLGLRHEQSASVACGQLQIAFILVSFNILAFTAVRKSNDIFLLETSDWLETITTGTWCETNFISV